MSNAAWTKKRDEELALFIGRKFPELAALEAERAAERAAMDAMDEDELAEAEYEKRMANRPPPEKNANDLLTPEEIRANADKERRNRPRPKVHTRCRRSLLGTATLTGAPVRVFLPEHRYEPDQQGGSPDSSGACVVRP